MNDRDGSVTVFDRHGSVTVCMIESVKVHVVSFNCLINMQVYTFPLHVRNKILKISLNNIFLL